MSSRFNFLDLSRYKKLFSIGEGQFSKVYRVEEIETGDFYAAKVSNFMNDEDIQDSNQESDQESDQNSDQDTYPKSEATLLLFREVNLMIMLNHPSVLKFIGYSQYDFNNDPLPTIVSEFATNGSLRDIINLEISGLAPDDWTFTKKLINIYGIASGMSYLHKHKVIHRDLKPENVLLDEFLYPKISDFGFSKITDILSQSMNTQSQKGIKGTPLYLAPEIFRNEEFTPSCDVYAFGFVVYEIMAGEIPFKYNIYEIMSKIAIEGLRPQMKEDVPEPYQQLIERCWSNVAKDRPSFDEIVDELKNNKDFITELVDEVEFSDYIEFIDNYETTFDCTKLIHFKDFIKIHKKELNDEEDNEIKEIETKEIEKNYFDQNNYDLLYPLDEFNKLSKDCQTVVIDAKNDPDKQFILGKSLIEGENNFTTNVELGFQYIKQSMKNNCLESIIYYTRQLIKGKLIPRDLDEAKKNLQIISQSQDSRIFLLRGKIYKKLNKLSKAYKYFKQGAKAGEKESMYKYAKIHFIGESAKKDDKKAMKYFIKSKDQGYQKSDYFLRAYNIMNDIKGFSNLAIETQLFFISYIIHIYKNNQNSSLFKEIYIQPEKTDQFFFNKSLKSPDFYKCLSKFHNVFIEIEYPSKSFKLISDLLIKIKNKNEELIKIGIVFVSFPISNNEECFSYYSYHKISTLVNQIPPSAFDKCLKITNISIPPSVTFIGASAFNGCSSLTKIDIPSSVTFIDESAFSGCSSLTEIKIPSPVTSIKRNTFYGCSSLSEISIPSSITFIDESAFSGCSSLTKIDIPSSVTFIGGSAFSGCSSLSEIDIPSSVTFIGGSAFSGCLSLTTIKIPLSVTSIEKNTFSGCSSLSEIDIPSSIAFIGESAFSGCSSLTKIDIPSSVTSIKWNTFYGCSSLTNIVIPSTLVSIEYHAFFGCNSLTSVEIPSTVLTNNIKFDEDFGLFDNLKEIIVRLLVASNVSQINKDIIKELFQKVPIITQIIIPESIKSIQQSAFNGYSTLKKVEIPSSVTSIGEESFSRCSSINRIEIPSSVTFIGEAAFSGCSSLTKIKILSHITSLSNGIFMGCSSLTDIKIPSSVKSIGEVAFYECTSLTEIEIPSAVNTIESFAFFKCSALTNINIPPSVRLIKSNAFFGCSSLTNIEIPTSVTYIGEAAFSGCFSLTEIEIPSSVTTLNSGVFLGCSSLTDVKIPSSVTSIGEEAFSGCSSIKKIRIPSSVTSLGKRSFYGCSSLKQISIPSTLNLIDVGIGSNVKIILNT